MEWTVARPSLIIKMNLEWGNISAKYVVDFSVNGSLLQRRGAGDPWPTITLTMNAEMAESMTASFTPASYK
jgi:hypothetical protein